MMNQIIKSTIVLLVFTIFLSCEKKEEKILVFSKTAGFRHGSIEAGIASLEKMGKEKNFAVVATEDATFFTEDLLKQYSTVVFLNTTGDILNDVQQAEFERYIQAGGGFVGVHAATDTEYEWPWYNKLVGAYFLSHPHQQEATLNIVDKTHSTTKMLGDTWQKFDEWYNFKDVNPDINVLIEIDENSYEGGKNGEHHPISWYHDYDGGRAFYTEMGHTDETFENPKFLTHLYEGIKYAIGNNKLNYDLAVAERIPEENRFAREVLDFNLNEPMELDELPGRGILFVERRGALKLYDFEAKQTKVIAQLDVRYHNEDGLIGLAVDPNYTTNNWIYLFYATNNGKIQQHISRFTLKDDVLDMASEKIILTIPTEESCCHSGGSLEFGPDGNLFIGVGDNTNPFASDGFAPIDEREGRESWDAQRSAGNTNDLRGKILRISLKDDGTYTIPKGNLFPEGTPKTRPEIYVMGLRNPFRLSVDNETGYVYWGDVGPDSGKDNDNRGPKGMGEFNQARTAANYGWPYTRGNNQVYNDYDFTSNTSGSKFDPNNLINDSPNNTGIQKLPPAQKSMIWFSYDASEEFPWLGKGGVNPMGGPVFRKSNFKDGVKTFPPYFEGKFIAYEWMRDWIYVVSMDDNENYVKADPFMKNDKFSHPMDMIFGSDGNLYVLEYGQSWNTQNMDARLNRVSYIEGNRAPVAIITANKSIGSSPLTVAFSGGESIDFDKDDLIYNWFFDGDEVQSTEANPNYTFTTDGLYTVKLQVTDKAGQISETNTKILVGNDAPEMQIDIDLSEKLYSDNGKINYNVIVTDAQDGTTADNSIHADKVKVTIDYIPEGKDMVKATIGHQLNTVPKGKQLIDATDCAACHAEGIKVNGPSYLEIAKKYTDKDKNYLIGKIIKGGSGVWGEAMMSAHPQLKTEEVSSIVDYILTLDAKENKSQKVLPLKGTYTFKEHIGKNDNGIYVLIASYLDEGNENVADSKLSIQKQVVIKAPILEAEKANQKSKEVTTWRARGKDLAGSLRHNSFLKFNNVALKGLNKINFSAFFDKNYHYKGTVEIREGAVNGTVIGAVAVEYFDEKKNELKNFTISVKPTVDKSSLFVVFKNEENKDQFVVNADSFYLKY